MSTEPRFDWKAAAKNAADSIDAAVISSGDPANWTREQAQAAQAELDELERTDPDVAVAAASYDRMVERVTGKAWFENGRQTDEQRVSEHVFEDDHCTLCSRHIEARHLPCWPLPSRASLLDGPIQTATPAERAAADELTRELDTVYAEPTAEQTSAAYALVSGWGVEDGYGYLATLVARALAAERAAIHARYEAVAEEIATAASDAFAQALNERGELQANTYGWAHGWKASAVRIRQVAAQ